MSDDMSGTTTVSVMDSSRVSTCLISMLLIVYGSFRSLNIEQEQREKEKKRQSESSTNLLTGEPTESREHNKFATLDTFHALCLPLGASISLLVMFFFFDSMQMLFAVCTASKSPRFLHLVEPRYYCSNLFLIRIFFQ